jgi:hypothetical protein
MLPDDLADKVEAAANDDGRSVSDWVRRLLARELDDGQAKARAAREGEKG